MLDFLEFVVLSCFIVIAAFIDLHMTDNLQCTVSFLSWYIKIIHSLADLWRQPQIRLGFRRVLVLGPSRGGSVSLRVLVSRCVG